MKALVSLELPAGLMAFSMALHSIIVTNLYLDKVAISSHQPCCHEKVQVCRVNLHLDESICSDLNSHEAEGNEVQAQVAKIK